ncbi:hypothetical protein B0H10DRAFT_1950381 [Mycena sp. CBHHK59/15]|nr:hypothetical protein B0H10DRAFT_1950381 [Mycena sp. CBHHK59/15]
MSKVKAGTPEETTRASEDARIHRVRRKHEGRAESITAGSGHCIGIRDACGVWIGGVAQLVEWRSADVILRAGKTGGGEERVSLHEERKETGESAPGKTEKDEKSLETGKAPRTRRRATRRQERRERGKKSGLEIQPPPRPPALENAAQRTKEQKAEEKTKRPSRDSRSLIYRGALP